MTSEELMHELKIPKERIAVLIGVKGNIKKEIEEKTNTRLDIDSETGEVFIRGEDGLDIFDAKEVVLAIGRGFNPKIALTLLKADLVFDSINIKDYAKNKETIQRLRGRVIGEDGKARRFIEESTSTSICVYGKTVSIIGDYEGVADAKQAVSSLLRGAPHSSVYKWLDKKRKLKKESNLL
ncbi:KH domain-containing protein [Candidatus Woesearchaeota archaeon]|nr:KH domain-containing protein [Candidatus Woesearchaeota archaeon]